MLASFKIFVADISKGTFYGGTQSLGLASPELGWQSHYKEALAGQGIDTYFVPSFSDSSVAPSDMYNTLPVADGLSSWDSAWPWASEGKASLSDATDKEYLAAAKAAKKTFMMRLWLLSVLYPD